MRGLLIYVKLKKVNEIGGLTKLVLDRSDIKDELEVSFGNYVVEVMLNRAVPFVEDGLKPVQRRILYGQYKMGNLPSKPTVKSARVVGDIMGKYHPHGDSAIYEALARLSKEWVVREPLVYMHGNNGSIDGDGAAAMRYTECRLSPLAMEMLNGLSKRDTVDWQLTFDDTDHEPVLLPAKFPNILVNGSSGIGVGYATDIPTHNLTEVLEATIKLVENPNTSLEEIIEVLPAPDFPTGGVIVGAKTLKDTYALGNGSVKLRGRYHTEVDKNKLLIVFDEIPYGAEKPKMVEKIQSIIENKQLHGLLAVADESGKDGLRFVLTCRKDVDPKVITSYLFKTTDLQKSIKMNMLMIANGKPRQLGVIAILNYFNQFRRSTIKRALNYDL